MVLGAVPAAAVDDGGYTDCRPTTTPLVFDGGYRVSMCYETADGTVGEARAGIWASGQSGLLWFFDRDNAEVLVKVLDGCSHNGRRWVFVAPVTDVAFNLHVTSSGGRQWTHRNPLGQTAVTRSDTAGFVCAEDDGARPATATGMQPEIVTGQAAVRSPILRGEYTDCRPTTTPLVFDGGYQVSLCYETAQGAVGEARAGIWSSNQSGLLWFFDRDNAEVLVKVLDGCSQNGRRWVFVAPVTDVAFNLHVTSSSGRQWTHRNRLGETATTRSDTAAFTCVTEDDDAEHLVPDARLRAAIGSALGLPSGAPISPAHLKRLRQLIAQDKGIRSLTGLEYATNLSHLRLWGNDITDVTPLAGLSNLTWLDLGSNEIADASPLAGLSNLTFLSLFSNVGATNQIADVSPLAGLSNLADLNLNGNDITDVTPLAGLSNLIWLGLRDNAIADVTPLAGLTNLTFLYLDGNAIADASPLANLTELTALDLGFNTIADASPLASLTRLTFLGLRGNSIADASPLAGLTRLTFLDLRGNSIADASPLVNVTKLTALNLWGNSISDASPLANLTELTELDLGFNTIADVSPLAGLADLISLDLRGNPLDRSSLDVHVPALLRRGVEVQFDRFQRKGEFDVELVFLGDRWSQDNGRALRRMVEWAVSRWTAVVHDDLPDHVFSQEQSGACGENSWKISPGERIDDLRVYVSGFEGRRGAVLGYGGPNLLRESDLPILGCIVLDVRRGNVPGLARHEFGHVLGIGTIWHDFVRTSDDPHFAGPLAVAAFDDAGGVGYAGTKVPLQSASDTAHWRVPVLGGEVMGPYGGGALSAITVQALADIGYGVDVTQADEYVLPEAAAVSSEGGAPWTGGRGRFSSAVPRAAGGLGDLEADGRGVRLLGDGTPASIEPAPFCGVHRAGNRSLVEGVNGN